MGAGISPFPLGAHVHLPTYSELPRPLPPIISPNMQTCNVTLPTALDRYLASNVCCRTENSFQDRHCIGHDALAHNSNSTKSDIAQKLKQGNIFWKIPMKIPVNMHYYSLVTENVDSMCQTKTGRGKGVYVLVIKGGGGSPSRRSSRPNGGSLRPRLWRG